ncbi:acetyl-CoA acetyltransferase [Prauserella marina]|uniref:Acetyl-CoA C-acetyltransferase n=1 Tax=Prauserella marina TaxID=530584 RepID=A0A222VQT3_9PSEU|nr:steroid 3-ketoacyl-CoA thiolase [Prauserella marina]ASR36277.1 acetyl-CoA acetyltransferase [Prauserella marina]PWV77053.1 acetyl-CoA C-acetyltransferase [Prauserella marina]SDD03313.1 acetyl-CoA C-acetyltransferase [Prauserella marina]
MPQRIPSTSAVLVDAARTPFGKRDGALSGVHAADLLGAVQRGVLDRTGVAPDSVGQVIGGCVTPIGEQFGNITRTAWLHAGLPAATGATTIDAQCSTALQAVLLVAGQIATGSLDVGLACGVEVMSRVPLTPKSGRGLGTPRPENWALDTPDQYTAADRIAARRGFGRADIDAYGLRSQRRAATAWRERRFARQIIPVAAGGGLVEKDEGLRDTSMAALAALTPTKPDGLHTAGTSSQVSDGASAALLMSSRAAEETGVTPLARLTAHRVVGGDTEYLLDGPVEAASLLFERTGMTVADIDLFEVNEAFAAVPMSFARVHGIAEDRLNVSGGAIALGHPAGATGIRLLATALAELERRDASTAMIAICASAATSCLILERL